MNRESAEILHALFKNGFIDRDKDSDLYKQYENEEVREELNILKEAMKIEIVPAGGRIYMLPSDKNDFFLKNYTDYRKDIKADSNFKSSDFYMMNYLAVYTIYVFFKGTGINPKVRDFIDKSELIEEFSVHCEEAAKVTEGSGNVEYTENFRKLAENWNSKPLGDPDSQKASDKNGILNRLLSKFKTDDLFYYEDDGRIKPTKKMDDLICWFLRRERIKEVNKWLERMKSNASDK